MAPADHHLHLLSNCGFTNPSQWRTNRASSKQRLNTTRCRSVVMKRMARLDRPRVRSRNAVEGKVRRLKKLVPNCESVGVEGLFRETADYIVALQMRVKVMQIMVDLLSGCDDDDDGDDE